MTQSHHPHKLSCSLFWTARTILFNRQSRPVFATLPQCCMDGQLNRSSVSKH